MTSSWLTDHQVAAEFGISWQQVQQRCRAGQWAHQRVGRKYRFAPEDIEQIKGTFAVKAITTPAQTWGRKTRRAS